jgi:hypothetical protein
MTDEQAAIIIALLESINSKLESVISGAGVDVNICGKVEVEGTVGTYESRG